MGEGWSGGGSGPVRAIPMVDTQLDSRDLFVAGRLITIAHGDQTYQLRLTAQNKLILTK
ncbi:MULTISPECIES: hemin uptake protein HemP [unclassified Xanthobacter]|uniref:hemin uptake protein HemP n=1 Tax=unclassified Xanthobacter TaxID=2623496 RepID=UPI001EE13AAF|nr:MULTISPECIES: hemin uptake protein HemP [unclassified Xanthobacter]